jgi:hypothetical protein
LLTSVDGEHLREDSGDTDDSSTISTTSSISDFSDLHYDGWVSEVISPLREFIDGPINPRDYYLDLQEISESSGGSIIYVARLAESNREHLRLPRRVKEKDHSDVISRRTTFVAIKSIPIMPTGSSKLAELLRELCFMRDLSSDHLVGMDALYLDPIDDALWIRMELMTRSLSSVVQLNSEGLVLADRQISACTRDVGPIYRPRNRTDRRHRYYMLSNTSATIAFRTETSAQTTCSLIPKGC